MPKNSLNVSLKGADDIFSTEESRQEQQREQVQQIPIGELFPFKNHPFKVLDDESMQRTVESVEQYGVLSPLIARPRPEGGYEIISGHRRQHAAQLAGLDTLPVIVRQMDDDAAVLLMVEPLRSRMNTISVKFFLMFCTSVYKNMTAWCLTLQSYCTSVFTSFGRMASDIILRTRTALRQCLGCHPSESSCRPAW